MQRQNMIFIFFVAFLLIIFLGYLFVIGEQKETVNNKKSTTKSAVKEDLGECNFVRNYNLLLVTESKDDDYVFLTLKELQVDEVKTVKVKREIMPSLKKGHYYRFSFSTKKKIHDYIDEIFAESLILNVEDKNKEEDYNTAICETHFLEN